MTQEDIYMEERARLFTEWKETYSIDPFTSDGIPCPACYFRQEQHILFVLRDMNKHEERDLCQDLMRDGGDWKTWSNVSRWSRALLDGTDAYPRGMSREMRQEQHQRIAVMNLKKKGGGSRTDGKELEDAVREQADQIRREIELCRPDLIVCGGLPSAGRKGNMQLLLEYVFPAQSRKMRSIPSGTFRRDWECCEIELQARRIPVVSFCHPQVCVLEGRRGHDGLWHPLYEDMLRIRRTLL